MINETFVDFSNTIYSLSDDFPANSKSFFALSPSNSNKSLAKSFYSAVICLAAFFLASISALKGQSEVGWEYSPQ